jgi:hypothetical protein
LIAPTETGNVTDTDFFRVSALKGGVESGPHLVRSTKVTAHVRTHADIHTGGRAEMKVGIKARDRMDLTYRDIDACSKRLEPVGWQVPEVSLYSPQIFKHDF